MCKLVRKLNKKAFTKIDRIYCHICFRKHAYETTISKSGSYTLYNAAHNTNWISTTNACCSECVEKYAQKIVSFFGEYDE